MFFTNLLRLSAHSHNGRARPEMVVVIAGCRSARRVRELNLGEHLDESQKLAMAMNQGVPAVRHVVAVAPAAPLADFGRRRSRCDARAGCQAHASLSQQRGRR